MHAKAWKQKFFIRAECNQSASVERSSWIHHSSVGAWYVLPCLPYCVTLCWRRLHTVIYDYNHVCHDASSPWVAGWDAKGLGWGDSGVCSAVCTAQVVCQRLSWTLCWCPLVLGFFSGNRSAHLSACLGSVYCALRVLACR